MKAYGLVGRKSSRIAGLLLFLFPLIFPQLTHAQETSRSDSLILEAVRGEIAKDSRLPIRGISISAFKGAVRLRGVVATLAQKKWIEKIAYSVRGVGIVDNQIWVDAPRVSDQTLLEMIQSQLQGDESDAYSRLKVNVQDRVVTLQGEVRSWGERHQLEEIISVIPGVREIKDRLKIRDRVNGSDNIIQKRVREALRQKIQMGGDYVIKVNVARGIVTLKGRVRNETDWKTALQTILFIPGVADVVDKIEVLPE